jgi:hypothetical protein
MNPRFEVDYKQRLEQSRTASNAYRLPRLGHELYRIYVIEEKKESKGLKPGTMNVYKSRSSKSQANWQQVLWAFIDDLETKIEPAYEVKWLKPKQATVLRMRGHRVETAQLGDQPGHVGPIDKPVRLGR